MSLGDAFTPIRFRGPPAKCRNWRTTDQRMNLAGTVTYPGHVIADLHDGETGEFIRTAVMADCGNAAAAKRYAAKKNAQDRLEYLRVQLREETISYDEIAELQSLTDYIPEDDVELLEAAGVPEK